jgi:hypothetical protein
MYSDSNNYNNKAQQTQRSKFSERKPRKKNLLKLEAKPQDFARQKNNGLNSEK